MSVYVNAFADSQRHETPFVINVQIICIGLTLWVYAAFIAVSELIEAMQCICFVHTSAHQSYVAADSLIGRHVAPSIAMWLTEADALSLQR